MEYVNDYLEKYYSMDNDISIYKIFIDYCFKEIATRMNSTTNIEDIKTAFKRVGITKDANDIIEMLILFAKTERLSSTIRINTMNQPLLFIYEEYAEKFCNLSCFPNVKTEIITENSLKR